MIPISFLKHTKIHWWKCWELFTVMDNNSTEAIAYVWSTPDPPAI